MLIYEKNDNNQLKHESVIIIDITLGRPQHVRKKYHHDYAYK